MTNRLHPHGPPPCQHPACFDTSHYRNGYVHCLDHDDGPAVAPPLVESETAGIATEDGLTVYRRIRPSASGLDSEAVHFGASCGSSRKTLRQMEEPNVMLSYATRDNRPWDGIDSLIDELSGQSADGTDRFIERADDLLQTDGEAPNTNGSTTTPIQRRRQNRTHRRRNRNDGTYRKRASPLRGRNCSRRSVPAFRRPQTAVRPAELPTRQAQRAPAKRLGGRVIGLLLEVEDEQ